MKTFVRSAALALAGLLSLPGIASAAFTAHLELLPPSSLVNTNGQVNHIDFALMIDGLTDDVDVSDTIGLSATIAVHPLVPFEAFQIEAVQMGSIFNDPIFTGDLITLTVGPEDGPGQIREISFGFGAVGFPAGGQLALFRVSSAVGVPAGPWIVGASVTAIDDFGDHTAFADATLTITAVPEPQTWALLAGGLALVGGVARTRRRATA